MKPDKSEPPLYFFLYPSELIALLHCRNIPVTRRVLYALAVYTGLRKGSLYALKWSGADFEHGTLTSLKSKTDARRLFTMDDGLRKLLAAWFEYQGRPKASMPIVNGADIEWEQGREALALRHDLSEAGIMRLALFERDPDSDPIRFHDLRATFVTWAKRQGRSDGWISDRTGHTTKEMLDRYDRAARTLEELRYVPFPDISEAIPELLEPRDNVVSLAASRARRTVQ
jgi:integrase